MPRAQLLVFRVLSIAVVAMGLTPLLASPVQAAGVDSQQAYVKASTTGGLDSLGVSIAIAGDTMVVGAPGEDSNATGVDGDQSDDSASSSGAAFVFTRS